MSSILTIIIAVVSCILVVLMVQLAVRNRLYKELKGRKQHLQELKDKPMADELKKVKDLNMTGQTESFFEKWRQDWDEIVTAVIPDAEQGLQQAEGHVAKFSFNKGRAALQEAAVLLEDADARTDQILEELHRLIDSQQKNTSEIEQLRHTYRDLKKNVLAHRHSFTIAERRLEELLDDELQKFQSFEEATSKGNYLEAREIVLSLEQGISYLQFLIAEIPNLQVECQSSLPAQLDDLLIGYNEMSRQGYVLAHLEIPREVQELKKELQQCLLELEQVQVVKVQERTSFLKERLDVLYDQLEAEVTSKHYVEKESYLLLDTLETLRHDAGETKEETQLVKQTYHLSDKDVEMQRYIDKQMTILLKRYDTLQLRIAEQDIAFSVIREEIEDIYHQVESVNATHEHYKSMLQALRKEEFAAYEALHAMRSTMTDAKRLLQRSNLPGLPEPLMISIQQAQAAMQRVYEKLEYKPLNMEAVGAALADAQALVDSIHTESTAIVERVNLVEKVIQYGNRYRSQDTRAAQELEQAEKLFREFEYEAALEQAAALLERLEPGVVERLEEFVKAE